MLAHSLSASTSIARPIRIVMAALVGGKFPSTKNNMPAGEIAADLFKQQGEIYFYVSWHMKNKVGKLFLFKNSVSYGDTYFVFSHAVLRVIWRHPEHLAVWIDSGVTLMVCGSNSI